MYNRCKLLSQNQNYCCLKYSGVRGSCHSFSCGMHMPSELKLHAHGWLVFCMFFLTLNLYKCDSEKRRIMLKNQLFAVFAVNEKNL